MLHVFIVNLMQFFVPDYFGNKRTINLIVFILALIGMNFFANYFRFDAEGFVILPVYSPAWINAPDQPRSNFDTFTLAFMAVFQCITIDNWNVILFNAGFFSQLYMSRRAWRRQHERINAASFSQKLFSDCN
jgi:hypothetical protein